MNPSLITDEQLTAFLVGESDPAESAAVAQALKVDPALARRAEAMRNAISGIQNLKANDPLFSLSSSQEHRLADLMAGRNVGWLASAVDRAREVVATIVMDTLRHPLSAVGYRGAATGGLVRAAADGIELDFRVSDAAVRSRRLVQGQLSSHDAWRSIRACPLSGSQPIEAIVESDGYFEVELPLGSYRWEVVGDERTLIIEAFDVSPQPPEES